MCRFLAIVEYSDTPAVLVCSGEEGAATQGSRRTALSRALRADSDLLVDLRALRTADASLILDLTMVACRLRRSGRRMVLRGAQPPVRRLIEALGFHRFAGVILEKPPTRSA
ncbi:MAG: STAS domain-containing protein [Solirubrobacteraceae bacterium]